jgi:hypothetical protein
MRIDDLIKEHAQDSSKGSLDLSADSWQNASITIKKIQGSSCDLSILCQKLLNKNEQLVAKGDTHELETTLLMQIETLDALFYDMLQQATQATMVDHLRLFADIAFKAQKQTRQTVSVLAEFKNPRRTTFVKQQNVAVNQQVNNATQDLENLKNPANELISETTYEAMDYRGTPEAIRADSNVATLEVCKGSGYLKRQGCEQTECV